MSKKNIPKHYLRPRWKYLSQDSNGILHIANYSVLELTKKYGTPFYVMVEQEIREKLRSFKDAFKDYPNLKPQYAAKCNSNLEILKIVREEGFELDASSIGEIILGLLADFEPWQISFTNLYKSEQDIIFAAKVGVKAITVDSIEELKRIVNVAEKLKLPIRIFIRFNPLLSYKRYTTKKQQYGIPINLAKKAIGIATKSEYIQLTGLHFHGAYVLYPEIYMLAIRKLIPLLKYAREQGAPTHTIDLGGGFPVEYQAKRVFTPEDVAYYLIPEIKKICNEQELPLFELIFEPGKYIVNTAGLGLIKVVSKKYLGNKKIIVTDGSTYAMFPDLMIYKCHYDILPATKMNFPRVRKFDICGCTCDCIDVLAANKKMPRLKENDILAVMDCGAYSNVMGSNFNNLKRPPMIMIKESGTIKLIRRRDRYSEMFAPELDVLKVADPKELKKFYNLFRLNINNYWNSSQQKTPKTSN